MDVVAREFGGTAVKAYLKARYSRAVVERALYWLAASCEWTLEESDTEWRVTILAAPTDAQGHFSAFERLLLDAVLRARISDSTAQLRESIVFSALNAVARGKGAGK